VQTEQSEAFEGPALAWLFREAQRLADTLAEHGVAAGASRNIVDAFVFQLCVGMDQHTVVSEGRSYTPTLTFLCDGVALAADPNSFEWHDYALGVVSEVFGEPKVDDAANPSTESPNISRRSFGFHA
jgi:hypothetical protein